MLTPIAPYDNEKGGKGSLLNRIALTNTDTKEVARAVMSIITELQNHPKHVQVLAITTCMKMLIDRFKESPRNVMDVVDNLFRIDNSYQNTDIAAAKAYLDNEV